MKKILLFFCLLGTAGFLAAQNVPELLYYKFDGAGTSVTNEASTPPVGTATATINGSMSQGSTGLCGGALIGTGGSSSTDYVNTGWATSTTGSWTISFWSSNVPSTTTLYYIFGDASAGSFRCFTGGVAGAGNWLLRGSFTDVLVTGGASMSPSVTTFVYDATAGNIKAYLNGTLVNTVAQSPITLSGTGPFKVGSYSTSAGLPSGSLMDEFRFYNRALDSTEVQLVYNQCLPLISSPNDAGVASIDEPVNFCPDTLDIKVTVKNYGSAIIDSLLLNWELNGVPQSPITVYGPLDTLGGSGSQTAQVTVTSMYFAANTNYDFKVWTSMPNAASDTVNWNDTLSTTFRAAMAGTYTIGGVGADYYSYNAAVSDLSSYGVCGPVEFLVNDSTYTEQITLSEITGASAVNTITFRSASGDSSLSILTYNGTTTSDNYTINFSGGDYFRFMDLTISNYGFTYSQVLNFGNGATNNIVSNCLIQGDTNTATTSTNKALLYSNNGQDHNNEFHQNRFRGGSYGVYFYGQGSTSLESGTVFSWNEMTGQYYMATRLYYQDGLVFHHNRIDMPGTYTATNYGSYFGYCDGMTEIYNNHITNTNRYGYGLYIYYCDAAPFSEGMIYNNMVQFGNNVSGTSYGIYLSNSTYQNLIFNSVNLTSTGAYGIYLTGGSGLNVYNNNVATNGTSGYAYYNSTGTNVLASDHNNFYASASNAVYWTPSAYPTVAAYAAATGNDTNSVSVDPLYLSQTDLHACNAALAGAGMAFGGVATDFDADPRNNPPAIGADEVISAASFTLGPDQNKCPADSTTIGFLISGATYQWNTGDSTAYLVVNAPGVYHVDIFTACDTLTDTITIVNDPLPVAGYSQNLSYLTASFVNASADATTYYWDFGDGSNSTQTDPVHVYAQDGIYNVCLISSNQCDSDTLCDSVAVCVPMNASFTYSIAGAGVSFNFTDLSSGTPVSWDWNFGDGSTDNAQNTSHTYASSGSYTVTLIVENICGDRDTIVQQLVVTGEEELTGTGISLYPNPSNGNFAIGLGTTLDQVKVEITDLTGKTIFAGDYRNVSQINVNAGNVARGVYILKMTSGEDQVIRKLIFE